MDLHNLSRNFKCLVLFTFSIFSIVHICTVCSSNVPIKYVLLSILGYFGGLLWLFFLASEDFNAKTYISENALLPALVETKYSEEYTARRHYDQLSEICKINL